MRRDRVNAVAAVLLHFLFGFVGIFGQHQLLQSAAEPANPLLPGETVERSILQMQKHRYAITLEAGQFVRIDLEETDADLVMAFRSPDDKNLLDYAVIEPVNGVKSIWAAVSGQGVYELRVMNYGEAKGNPAYRLKIGEIRPAKVEEMAFTDGMRIYNDAFNPQATDILTAEVIRAKIDSGRLALEKFSLAKTPRQEARTLWQMGVLSSRIGGSKQTIDFYRASIEKSRQIGDRAGEANTLRDLGTHFTKISDWKNAFETLTEALKIAHEIHRDTTEAGILNLFGEAYAKFGDLERAAIYFQQSSAIYLSISNISRGIPLNNLGRISLEKGDAAKAEDYFRQAINAVRAENYRFGVTKIQEVGLLNNLGRAEYALGKRDKAIETFNQAFALAIQTGNQSTQASTYKSLGRIYLDNSENEKAVEFFRKALSLSRRIEDIQEIPDTLLCLAKAESRQNNLAVAQTLIEEAIGYMEKERASVQIMGLRDSFSAGLKDFYSFYIELLMKRNRLEPNKKFAETAFQANERARARGLLNLLAESKANIREGVDPKLLQKEAEMRDLLASRLENQTRVLSEKSKPGEPEKLKAEIEQIRASLEQTQAEICRLSPKYTNLTQPKILGITEIQSQIVDENTVLLEYGLGAEKSYLWVVGKNSFEVFDLPGKRTIEAAVREFNESLTATNREVKFETPQERESRIAKADLRSAVLSNELSRTLIFPAASRLEGKRVLIVADGALQFVPFAALSAPNSGNAVLNATSSRDEESRTYFIETNEIVYLPSASVLAVLRQETENRVLPRKTLAILADPVFGKDDERLQNVANKTGQKPTPMLVAYSGGRTRGVDDGFTRGNQQLARLPFTRREANSIAALVGSKQQEKLLDFAANRTSALSPDLANYRLIHFATHGIIDNDNPELSGIALSMFDQNGREQDGFLRVGDIYNLKLPAEMVVLSGCKTGLGREIRGEGVVGLTRGFMYAGAKRVTVSLWDVNDEATAELMSRFYREMLGERKLQPAAALRQAQISMIRDSRWQNPYFWSTFLIHGEPK